MKPAWKPIKVKLGQIRAWDKNPRMSTKAQAQRIIASERKFGQPVPFLVSPDFLLYDGHQRLAAWFTVYGADYEMDAMQSDRPLSEDEHKELVIVLHTGATGSWNWDALSGWSAGDLQEWGMNGDALKGWNNDASNLKELLNAENLEPVDSEPQIDRAAELAEKWQTKSGQLWELGEHRLLIGDCTVRENVERLMGGERAGILLQDPPYGMNLDADYSKMPQVTVKGNKYDNVIGDNVEFDFSQFSYIECKEQFWWGADYYADKLPKGGSWYVWDKRNDKNDDALGSGFELCWSKTPHKRRLLRYLWSGFTARDPNEKRNHPTQKPIAMYQEIINEHSNDGEIVVDTYAGSGTTIIAAHNLNRRCYAMEISEKYSAVILERYFTATGITPELVE